MRKFKCQDCQHEFEVPHGTGVRGQDMTCPQCGSANVFRSNFPMDEEGNWAGRGRAAVGSAWSRWMDFTGRGRGGFRGRGDRGRGWRRNTDQQQETTQQENQEQK